jgi:hypothetical protein
MTKTSTDIQSAFHSLAVAAMDAQGLTAEDASRYVMDLMAQDRPALLAKLAHSLGMAV